MDTIILTILVVYFISFLAEWRNHPFNGFFVGTILNVLIAILVLIVLGISAIIKHFF